MSTVQSMVGVVGVRPDLSAGMLTLVPLKTSPAPGDLKTTNYSHLTISVSQSPHL